MSYDLLEGIKVVELSMYAFAPSCAAVLADWGADVVKVVPPDIADPMRGTPVAGLPPARIGVAFLWEIVNRGKRCIGLNVSTDEGRAVLHDIVRGADVFVTNLLPDARAKFGVDVDDIRAIAPDVIYARASGHGPKGPEAATGGFDHTDFWARTGMAHAATMVSDEFVPQPGPAMGDLASGAFLAGAVAAALYRRTRTGEGAVIDVSLLSAATWMFSPAMVAADVHGVDVIPRPRHADLPNPLVAGYQTRDDRTVYFAGVQTEKNFTDLCQRIDRTDLLTDPRFVDGTARTANARELIVELDRAIAARDLAEWIPRLNGLAIPWAVAQTPREALDDAQVLANGYVTRVDGPGGDFALAASPAQFDGRAPELVRAPEHGEHTEEILLAIGRDWDEILALKERGVVS